MSFRSCSGIVVSNALRCGFLIAAFHPTARATDCRSRTSPRRSGSLSCHDFDAGPGIRDLTLLRRLQGVPDAGGEVRSLSLALLERTKEGLLFEIVFDRFFAQEAPGAEVVAPAFLYAFAGGEAVFCVSKSRLSTSPQGKRKGMSRSKLE